MPHSPRLTPLRKATGNISLSITLPDLFLFFQSICRTESFTDRQINRTFFLYLNVSSCNGIISKYKI